MTTRTHLAAAAVAASVLCAATAAQAQTPPQSNSDVARFAPSSSTPDAPEPVSPPKTPDGRTYLEAIVAIPITGSAQLEHEGEVVAESEYNETMGYGVSLYGEGYAHPFLSLGCSLSALFIGTVADAEDDEMQNTELDLSPTIKVRIPVVRQSWDILELYARAGAGFTLNILDQHAVEEASDDGIDAPSLGIGWNVFAGAGLQVSPIPQLGLFAEGGWQMKEMYFQYGGETPIQVDVQTQRITVKAGVALQF